tara:strand:+ start:725 stop:1246 length:522 start_codon:yes stop_codon:yes gene_type:complete
MVKNRAIFFDRDGILIKAPIDNSNKPKSIKEVGEIEYVENITEVCRAYKSRFYLIMVTNQPDVNRKVNTLKNVQDINNEIKKKLELDDIFICYSDDDNCLDRKPNPGMIMKAQKKYQLNLKKSYFIGDRWRDIEASFNAGCKSILLNYNYSETINISPDFIIENLKQLKEIIK